jgi:rapamycin-insensitive companion of mTOR
MASNSTGGEINLLQPSKGGKDGRSYSSASLYPPRGQSLAVTGPQPGSFSSDVRSIASRADTIRTEIIGASSYMDDDARTLSERRQEQLRTEIEKERKIKIGSENMLEALNSKKVSKDQKAKVEAEYNSSARKLEQLNQELQAEIQRGKESQAPEGRLSFLFRNASGRPGSGQALAADGADQQEEEESPTFVLSELLQELEAEGEQPEYYVEKANQLVELFKRHPTLKYDLAWSIFGLRMQTMLLSDSREVIAAGYRVMRHAITDRKSLQIIRDLQTDYLVTLSLVKDNKATVEREQALKFVRSFLDVKDGVKELSVGVIRTVVAVADHNDDRLRNIATLTLAEILVRDPALLVTAGGMGTLTDALGDPNYRAAQSLTGAFLYLLDIPSRRKYLRSGHELEMPIAAFTESPVGHSHEEKLKANAKVIVALLRSWPGLLALSMNDFLAIRSLIASLYIPLTHVRNILLELLTDILRIKPPSWSSSFLAGRRLTTYARVTNLKATVPAPDGSEQESEVNRDLVEHFLAILLAVLLHCGLVDALLHAESDPLSLGLKRKTTLLLGEVLKRTATKFDLDQKFISDDRFIAIGTIYQVDSVNRTLYRSDPTLTHAMKQSVATDQDSTRQSEQSKLQQGLQVDEAQFRAMMIESGVLNHSKYFKWRWDIIQKIIDGPLRNPKRLEEARESTRFWERIEKFYSPFKEVRFSDAKNTKPNQRYVRIGCSLMTALLQSSYGISLLSGGNIVRQIAECLAHYDRASGISSEHVMFSPARMNGTLTGGYFAMLGALSKDLKGLEIFERWKIFNMLYHIIEIKGRDDLIRAILSGMDYSIDSHLRIVLSKAMTSCSKDIRIFATRLLRKYATRPIADTGDASSGTVEWAIRLLVTQLYDPEIDVSDVAIKILEEACAQKHSLEYIVKCRPALDHLGPIGAPLLLRFLSTSVGYKYLDELDYITKEMDDWFLGRNDDYVALIEASLARALADIPDKPPQQQQLSSTYDDTMPDQEYGVVPPHFYRELTRTVEGCKLLRQKGHFDEFVATIKDLGMEDSDPEIILKIKGCLWAVGNVGSMELGAPFLEMTDVVRDIVRIAESSEVMTVRGTAFFALGLISRSLHGQEILLQYGWDGTENIRGESLGYAIPLDITKLFSMRPWKAAPGKGIGIGIGTTFGARKRADSAKSRREREEEDRDPITARILKSVNDLGNTVLLKKAKTDINA